MSSLALIRSQIEKRVPGALQARPKTEMPVFCTGIPEIDQYGIPSGGLTQLWAPSGVSSGKTSVMIALLARATRAGRYCALVDANDRFDPVGACAAGVELNRLLWVRCRQKSRNKAGLEPLEQAFKAADILVQNGGFAVIAVDVADVDEHRLRKVPLTSWFRFSRVVEKTETALVFLTSYPAAKSCAALSLNLKLVGSAWSGKGGPPHGTLLEACTYEVECERSRDRKPPGSASSQFGLSAKWI